MINKKFYPKKLVSILFLLVFSNGVFAQMNSDKLKELETAISKNEYQRLTGVVISKSGKIVHEKYYNGFDENSQHDTRSVGKTITSILIGIAIDKGFIKSEKETVIQYFADKKPLKNPDKRKEKITIEDLLTMSSVLECNDSNPASRGNEERMYIIEDYFKFFLDLPIRGKPPWESDLKDLLFQRRFRYCTAGTVLLGGVIERSTKMKVEEFAKKHLFEPMHISNAKWQFIPLGTAMTGGGLRLKARDFIKLGNLYLNGGKFKDKQIVSKEWVEKSTKSQANARQGVDYGYLWWLPKFGQKDKKYSAFAMFGNGGNKVAVFPKLNLVVVLTNRMYGRRLGHQQTDKILNNYIIPAMAESK